ncbi:MAG TPA: DUF368 domain-containing protein [Anaerolineae bacterium]|nr:DUF368 domain-containing protein [Anaerolineae bacterium]HMR63594.1 DUF368 domain-containing protein [Anaerolineae bacterium]
MIKEKKQTSRTLADYAGIAARGFAMGAADVVPGVSGGTMAFILGIYEELIESLRQPLSLKIIRLALNFKIKEVLQAVNWQFLGSLGIGILAAIFTLASFLESALVNYPALVWSFFFGLVVASIFTVIKRVKRWGLLTYAAAIVGTIAAYITVGLVPIQTPEDAWFIFLSGFIAICAMILPGISGSFILVLLGKYQYILSAVTNRDFLTLIIFSLGCGIGLVTFAQVLGWLFKRYHDVTVAVLIGLMVGSLRKIWPWKETLSTILDRHGAEIPVEQVNILPPVFDAQVAIALVLALVGFAVVFLLDTIASRREPAPA